MCNAIKFQGIGGPRNRSKIGMMKSLISLPSPQLYWAIIIGNGIEIFPLCSYAKNVVLIASSLIPREGLRIFSINSIYGAHKCQPPYSHNINSYCVSTRRA